MQNSHVTHEINPINSSANACTLDQPAALDYEDDVTAGLEADLRRFEKYEDIFIKLESKE